MNSGKEVGFPSALAQPVMAVPCEPRRIARTVALLLAGFGMISAFLLPPCLAPDEGGHFLHAYDLSEGRFMPSRRCPDECGRQWGGTLVPKNLVDQIRELGDYHRLNLTGQKLAPRELVARLHTPLEPDRRKLASFWLYNVYSFAAYIPQAAGILLGRAAHGSPLMLMYAGRLTNLTFAVILVYWAIRLIPVGRGIMGAVVFIPMTVHQLASLSGDTSVICASFLVTALLLRIALDSAFPVRPIVILTLCALAAWIPLCKLPYATLFLLYLAIPVRRLGSLRNYFALGTLLLALVLVANLYSTWLRKRFVPDHFPVGPTLIAISDQTAAAKHAPLRLLGICLSTIGSHWSDWLYSLGALGPLTALMHPFVVFGYVWFLVFLALAEFPGTMVSTRLRLAAGALSSSCVILVLVAQFVLWNSIGTRDIQGFQGRYLIPILPGCLLMLANRSVRVDSCWLSACWLGACVGAQVGAVIALLGQYYLHLWPWVAPCVPLCTALVVGASALWLRVRIIAPAGSVADLGCEQAVSLSCSPIAIKSSSPR